MERLTTERLREAIKVAGSVLKFSKAAKVSDATIYKGLNSGVHTLSVETMSRLSAAADEVLNGAASKNGTEVKSTRTRVPARTNHTEMGQREVLGMILAEGDRIRGEESLAERMLRLSLEVIEIEKQALSARAEREAIRRMLGK